MSAVGDGEQFERLLSAASAYWGKRHHRPGACVVVEAMQQDVRLVVRNLLLANAICDLTSARLVVLTGTDRELSGVLWERFDVERVRRLAEAFGAAEIIDVHDLVDRRLADEGDGPADGIGSAALEALERATLLRLSRTPRLPGVEDERHRARRGRSRALSAVYDRLFAELSPVALVTGQVDYDQWGLAVETAMRRDVPVVHTQSGGSMGAYALFPGTPAAGTFHEELTGRLARYFDECVWPQRNLLRPGAELVAWRVKGERGSWWRGGSVNSFELRTETERRQLRGHGCDRLGLDPDRPIVTVFQHAVSDAVGTNREVFEDFAEWCAETAEFAADEDAVNWLFLDHPEQDRHDSTGHFAALAGRHARRPHLAFLPRQALSKNMLWSMTDVGVTVRGRVACELPAFGIPVIQAGWSPMERMRRVARGRDAGRLLAAARRGGLQAHQGRVRPRCRAARAGPAVAVAAAQRRRRVLAAAAALGAGRGQGVSARAVGQPAARGAGRRPAPPRGAPHVGAARPAALPVRLPGSSGLAEALPHRGAHHDARLS